MFSNKKNLVWGEGGGSPAQAGATVGLGSAVTKSLEQGGALGVQELGEVFLLCLGVPFGESDSFLQRRYVTLVVKVEVVQRNLHQVGVIITHCGILHARIAFYIYSKRKQCEIVYCLKGFVLIFSRGNFAKSISN